MIIGFVVGILNSCKKYDESPVLSLKTKTKRLSREWQIQDYYRNGNMETSQLLITNYLESYNKNGSHTRIYIDKNENRVSETGQWKFDNNKEEIRVTGIGSIEWTDQTSSVSSSS